MAARSNFHGSLGENVIKCYVGRASDLQNLLLTIFVILAPLFKAKPHQFAFTNEASVIIILWYWGTEITH